MSVADLRAAVALLDEARSKADDPRERKRWGRRRWALRARLRAWEDLPRRISRAHGLSIGNGARTVDPELIGATPKRVRAQLAKAELWLVLAVLADEYLDDDQTVDQLGAVYGLDRGDLAKLCAEIGDELERRAARAGSEHAWW